MSYYSSACGLGWASLFTFRRVCGHMITNSECSMTVRRRVDQNSMRTDLLHSSFNLSSYYSTRTVAHAILEEQRVGSPTQHLGLSYCHCYAPIASETAHFLTKEREISLEVDTGLFVEYSLLDN